ncbi:MMPL family transporter [Plantactinospora sp. DSM 117369]
MIARRPRVAWLATSLALGALALGTIQLDATGLTSSESFRGSHESERGAQVLARHFAAGVGTPIAVVSHPGRAERVRATLAAVPGVDSGSLTPTELRAGQAYLEATLTDPADSRPAYDTVDRVRAALRAVPEAQALVGGETAIRLDVQRTARSDRNLLVPIVFAVVFAILVLLLRSLVAPLLLVGTVVLSFGAALGASVLVFRHVFGFTGEDSSLPLYLFVFLVALGVDYNIFLMTRVREETVRHGARRATLIGLAATGGVITSAGLVLAGTFADHTTADDDRPARLRGGVRHPAGHRHRPVRTGTRTEPGRRPVPVVATPTVPRGGPGWSDGAVQGRRHRRGSGRRSQHLTGCRGWRRCWPGPRGGDPASGCVACLFG